MKRKMNLILLLTAAVMLLFTCFAYAAGGNGSISVVLKTSKENPLPEGKYSVALYRIGDEDPDAEAGWSLLSPFDSLQISAGMKAEDLRALAEKAAGIIAGQHIASSGSKEAALAVEALYPER